MIRLPKRTRPSPIGLDIGSHSIKLVQLSADRSRLLAFARIETSRETGTSSSNDLSAIIRRTVENGDFSGREAVVAPVGRMVFVQSLRVPRLAGEDLQRAVEIETASRLPSQIKDSKIQFLESGDVRQGEQVLREIVAFACPNSVISETISVVQAGGLEPVAIDVEPCALVRAATRQFRRDDDAVERVMLIHVGARATLVAIVQGAEPLFVKYLDVGGKAFEEAVIHGLGMEASAVKSLRNYYGDRKIDSQDSEVVRSIEEALRPSLDRLAHEVSLCARYIAVTFRGQPLSRFIVGGGEAFPKIVETFEKSLEIPGSLSDPFRSFQSKPNSPRPGAWDLAVGLALKEVDT